ncbi:MAG: hypothetical protein WCV62_02835 [Candidatus Peribacteraceae bacterium]|jgi:hypothetical protein
MSHETDGPFGRGFNGDYHNRFPSRSLPPESLDETAAPTVIEITNAIASKIMSAANCSKSPLHVLLLVKGGQGHVYAYDDAHCTAAVKIVGLHLSNPELGLEWSDAAILSEKIRQAQKEGKATQLPPDDSQS